MASKSSPALGCSNSCNALDSVGFNSDGMREFKFRAFDPEARKMIYKPETLRRVLYYEKDNGFHMGRVKSKTNGDWVQFHIMQWTGLFDKTGSHIWEGDLLRWAGDDDKNFTAFEVFFHDGNSNAAYDIGYSISRTHHQGNVAGGYIPPFKPKTTKQMIVIGNIFQDKHLLK